MIRLNHFLVAIFLIIGVSLQASSLQANSEFNQMKSVAVPEVKSCSYLAEGKLCKIGIKSAKCVKLPKEYELIQAKIYKQNNRVCLENEVTEVSLSGTKVQSFHSCGEDKADFYEKNKNLDCQPWDSCPNCESGMRIGN